MNKNLEYLKYLAVKHREVDFKSTVRFTEESGFVYPKDLDYVIECIYMWDDVSEEFEFRITRPDNTEPVMPNDETRKHTYTVVRDHHLDIKDFNAVIRGTDIEMTFEEMKNIMLTFHPKFKSRIKKVA